jgi:hypothetical protein
MKDSTTRALAMYDAVFIWKDLIAVYTEKTGTLSFMKDTELIFSIEHEKDIMQMNELRLRSDLDAGYSASYLDREDRAVCMVKTEDREFHWWERHGVYIVGVMKGGREYDIAALPTVRADGKNWSVGVIIVEPEKDRQDNNFYVDYYLNGKLVKTHMFGIKRKFNLIEADIIIEERSNMLVLEMIEKIQKERINLKLMEVDRDNNLVIPDKIEEAQGNWGVEVEAVFEKMERIK